MPIDVEEALNLIERHREPRLPFLGLPERPVLRPIAPEPAATTLVLPSAPQAPKGGLPLGEIGTTASEFAIGLGKGIRETGRKTLAPEGGGEPITAKVPILGPAAEFATGALVAPAQFFAVEAPPKVLPALIDPYDPEKARRAVDVLVPSLEEAVETGKAAPITRAVLEGGLLAAPFLPKALKPLRGRLENLPRLIAEREAQTGVPFLRQAPAEAGAAPFTPKQPPLEAPAPPFIPKPAEGLEIAPQRIEIPPEGKVPPLEVPKLAELPPTVKTPLETAGGGLGFARGGPELIPASKLMENAKIEAKNPKTFIIEEGPKKTLFSNFNRLADEFRRISPGLGKVADDAFLRGTATRAEIAKAQVQVEKAMGGLKPETKIRVRQAIEGKIPETDLSPLERQRVAEGRMFFEGYRQKFIQNFRGDLLRPFTSPRQRVIIEAAKQPTPETAAEFVQKADFKQFGARKPFTEELAQAAAEYKDFENWGMENYFHRLYPGHLRMLVRRGGEVETIGFAKDVRQAQELFNQWGELNKIAPDEAVELILFEKRAIPSELKDILGKDKFEKWAEAVEGGAKQIRLKTSRGGFFAAIGKLTREGEISRDVAGDVIATAVFPRTAKRKIGALKPRKLEGELLGLAEPDQAMRALAYSAERKFFVDKLRSQAEGELAKIKDPATRRWLEEQIDAIAGFPSSWDMSFKEFVNKLHPEAGDVAMKVINGQALAQVILRLGGTNLRFPLVNKLQPLQTVYPLVGERVFTQAMLDKTLAYKPGTWQAKAWQESGLANLPTKFEGTDIPFPIRAVRGAGDAARDVATGLIKLSEVDNWKDSYFAIRRAAKKLGYSDAEANAFGILSVRDTQFPRVPEADIPALRPRVVSQTFGQFQSFNLSYLQFLKKLGKGEKVSPAQLTSPTGARIRGAIGFGVAGGVKALTSPITLLATKMGVMTGVAIWLNEQYEKLKKEIGEQAANAIYFGPAGLGFVDLSRSISLQVPFVSPSGEALSSPVLSSIKNIVTAPEGKKLEAVARETPILGPIRRALAPENVFERQLPKLTTEEKLGKVVGFQPARVSGELLPLESAQITDKKVREERKEAVRRYLDAREAQDIEKAKAIRIEAIKSKLWRSSDDFLESVKLEKKQRAMTFEERKARGLLKQHRVIVRKKKD